MKKFISEMMTEDRKEFLIRVGIIVVVIILLIIFYDWWTAEPGVRGRRRI